MKKLVLVILLLLSHPAIAQTAIADKSATEFWREENKYDHQTLIKRDSVKGIYRWKDSLDYEQAMNAYQHSNKQENRVEFVRLYQLHLSWARRDAAADKQRDKDLVKKYGAATAQKLLEQKTWIGMTDKMVIDEFGYADIKKAVTASGVTETWYYLENNPHCAGNCPVLNYYMVFKNHKLIAIGDL